MRRAAVFFREHVTELEAYAEAQFDLNRIPEGSKSTKRAQLQQVEKSTGRKMPALHMELPPAFGYVWITYLEVSRGNPLTYTEIKAWCDLTGNRLTNTELELILRLDTLRNR